MVKKGKKKKHHEIVGYTTSYGILLDLDKTRLEWAIEIADRIMEKHNLEGYLITESSPFSHHIIFNKYIRNWKKVLEILFKLVWSHHYYLHNDMPSLTNWAILQAIKGSCTLRVSNKKRKPPPKILVTVGEQDKIIKEYLDIRNI